MDNQQPNFNMIANNIASIGMEMAKCENIPAVQDGRNIVTAIENVQKTVENVQKTVGDLQKTVGDVQKTVDEGFTRLNGRMGALEDKVGALDNRVNQIDLRIRSNQANQTAALENGINVGRFGSSIVPLRDPQNRVIPNFPSIISQLENITGVEASRILEALELDPSGSIEEKRVRLRRKAGISGIF